MHKAEKKILIVVAGLLILLVTGAVYYFYPQPLIKDMTKSSICLLQYRADGELCYAKNYNEAAVLQALSETRIQRTLNNEGPCQLKKLDIIVWLDNGAALKEVRLGRENYCSEGYGSTLYSVLNPAALYSRIYSVLDNSLFG